MQHPIFILSLEAILIALLTFGDFRVPGIAADFFQSPLVKRDEPILIDNFTDTEINYMGKWHGSGSGPSFEQGPGWLNINTSDPDKSYYTRLSNSCSDISSWESKYLHIDFEGSSSFSIALQQHNEQCNESISPFPETWDEVNAARYAFGSEIWVPINHFHIEKSRAVSLEFRGFYTNESTTLYRVEIVGSKPSNVPSPPRQPTGQLFFHCTRPNSLAFAIDDGAINLAQEMMQAIKEEGIPVTFFVVGKSLLDRTLNFSNVYREMYNLGHQVALHSFSHPKMESLASSEEIDLEIQGSLAAYKETFEGNTSYFRPPYGSIGARTRESLATHIANPYIINWDIDIQDWRWGTSDTPEKQVEAFKAGISKGGNLVVMHYVYPSTVRYFREFVRIAKETGKKLMRVDQCMEDPRAPELQ